MFCFQAFPCDVIKRLHILLHLGKDITWVGVAPIKTQSFGKFSGDQINLLLLRLGQELQRGPSALGGWCSVTVPRFSGHAVAGKITSA